MSKDTVQLLSISYDELESGVPAINICSELTLPITSKTLARSFISYYDNDMHFKLCLLSGNSISFKAYGENSGMLEMYFKKEFMGYVLIGELYNVFIKIYQTLTERVKTNEE